MAKTISLCQGKGCLAHNNRTFYPKNVDRTRTPDNVVFVRKSIQEAYEELFNDAVAEYNAKQKRKDRQIQGSYYEYQFGRSYSQNVIESPDKRKSFYEDVVQIGTKDDTGVGSPDSETARICLTEYMNGFEKRNPNFRVFNAVLHMDEATPHLHIDYIPIGHYKRGIPVQNGISQALKEMDYGGGRDAIARWRKAEYDALRKICEEHGIEIAEPQQSRGTLSVEEYKEQKRQEEYIVHMKELELSAEGTEVEHKAMFGKHIISNDEYEKLNEEKKALAVQKTDIEQREEQLQKDRETVTDQLIRAEEIRRQAQKDAEETAAKAAGDREKAAEDRAKAAEELDNAQWKRRQADSLLYRQKNINELLAEEEKRTSELHKKIDVLEKDKKASEKKYDDLKGILTDCMCIGFNTDDKSLIGKFREICDERESIKKIISEDITLKYGEMTRPVKELVQIYSEKFHGIQEEMTALREKYDTMKGMFTKVMNAIAALIDFEPFCRIIPDRAMDMIRGIQSTIYGQGKKLGDEELVTIALTAEIDDDILQHRDACKRERESEEYDARGYEARVH